MTNKIKKRIFNGISASGFGQIVTIAIQVFGVPVFLHSWGKDLYGEWLILTALPIYISMSDIGIRTVAGNEMTMRYAKGDSEKVLDVFQSVWAVSSAIFILILSILMPVIWLLPLETIFNLSQITQKEAFLVLFLFIIKVIIAIQTDLLCVGYRCSGNYARGVLINNIVRFTEFFVMLGAVWSGVGPVAAATTFLAVGFVGPVFVRFDLKKICPWLQYGFKYFNFKQARVLFRPGVASMALSLSPIFANQAVITVLGITLGPASVVLFSTLRTLTRFAFQIVNIINNAIMPEMSLSLGAGDNILAAKIHNYSCRLCLWLNILMITFLLMFGRYIYIAWTNHVIEYDITLCMILLLTILLNAIWSTSSMVLVATNNIHEMSICYLISNIIAVVLAYIAGLLINIHAVALSLIFVEIVMIKVVIPRSLRIINVSILDFLKSNLNLRIFFEEVIVNAMAKLKF